MKTYLVNVMFELDAESPEAAARTCHHEMMKGEVEIGFNVHELDEAGDLDIEVEPVEVVLAGYTH